MAGASRKATSGLTTCQRWSDHFSEGYTGFVSNRPRVADALFESLLYEIVDGVRPPGSQLPAERELAADTGVNRQAVIRRRAVVEARRAPCSRFVNKAG